MCTQNFVLSYICRQFHLTAPLRVISFRKKTVSRNTGLREMGILYRGITEFISHTFREISLETLVEGWWKVRVLSVLSYVILPPPPVTAVYMVYFEYLRQKGFYKL
jgi:hypothetical protein